MKGDVAVARSDVRVALGLGHVPVENDDIGATGDGLLELLELARLALAPVDALQDEGRSITGGEGPRERLGDGQRVLALGAHEVEHEQEEEPRRETEIGARECRRWWRLDRDRNHDDGDIRLAPDGLPDVLARDPHLVEEEERPPVLRPEDVRLPEPHSDGGTPEEELDAHVVRERGELVGVETDQVRVVEGRAGHLEPDGVLLAARRAPIRNRRERDLGALEPAAQLARDLAQSRLRLEEAHEVHARLGIVGDRDHADSDVHSSSGRTTPRHCPLKTPRAESPSPASSTSNETAW